MDSEYRKRIKESVERRLGKAFARMEDDCMTTLFSLRPERDEMPKGKRSNKLCTKCGKLCFWGTYEQTGRAALGERDPNGNMVLVKYEDRLHWENFKLPEHLTNKRYKIHFCEKDKT